ncbi:MAG: hypothetical protein IKP45_09780 [Bacteroidales bacterium]|nr:hypothetical protein [Bacteroidales bacterium]
MKTRFYIFAVAVIMAAVFSGCKEKPEEIWLNEGSVTTDVASEVTVNSAKLQGAVYPLEVEVTERGFYYDTTREMYSLQKIVATDGFSSVVTSLESNTTYYYYAYATAYGKTKDGDVKMFKTKEPLPLEGTIYGHEYVDLGLPSGTLWATCNVGASSPTDYGTLCAHGTSVTWGGNWRTPTRSDLQELIGSCSSEWTTMNNVNGRKFTGSNGKSIFLPAAGNSYSSSHNYGHYWSSTDYYYLYFSSGSTCDVDGQDSYYEYKRSIRPCCPR